MNRVILVTGLSLALALALTRAPTAAPLPVSPGSVTSGTVTPLPAPR